MKTLDRLRAELTNLREESSALEPDAPTRTVFTSAVRDYCEHFLSRLPELPAYETSEEKGAGIRLFQIEEQARPIDGVLDALREHVDTPGLNTASAGHLGSKHVYLHSAWLSEAFWRLTLSK